MGMYDTFKKLSAKKPYIKKTYFCQGSTTLLAGNGSVSHSRDDPRAQRMPCRGYLVYHLIWLPYGSLHRVSLAGHGSVSHSRDDPPAQRVPSHAYLVPGYRTMLPVSYYLMAASTEWASQGMVVCLTVGMTLLLKECPLMSTLYPGTVPCYRYLITLWQPAQSEPRRAW
jgi:hypothetical protein